jgi:hypothetical protein
MSKFTCAEKETVKSVIARLSVKRIPEREILKEVFEITGKSITRRTLYHIKHRIKQESFQWYQNLQQNRYEYIFQFKERIREIESLMRKHHEIIDNNPDSPTVQQKSLEELHRLNISLSNYYDVAPQIVNFAFSKENKDFTDRQKNDSISISQQKEIIV